MRERSKQRVRKLTSFLMPIAMLGSLLVGMATPVAAEEPVQPTTSTTESVADTSSLNAWESTTGNDTKNMGRIWTDKTVSTEETIQLTGPDPNNSGEMITHTIARDGSDFLIAYSALSSTAQISTMQSTTEPLDIVLVLDGSSSLWNPPLGQEQLGPKLQAAADTFISSVLQKSTDSVQHRIAIVRFGGKLTEDSYKEFKESKIITDFTSDSIVLSNALTQATAQEPDVPTASHFGLQLAEDLFNGRTDHNREQMTLGGARPGAKKVVVFFTDGVPTDPGENESDFNSEIAAQAVNSAKELKAMGATIYAVGVFNGGDGGTGGEINTYMNAISSNCPNANSTDGSTIELGASSDVDGKYYTSSEDGDKLNDMFNAVLQDIITKPNSSPTVVTEGNDGTTSGYITFTDTLGDYMQVDEKSFTKDSQTFNGLKATIVFADQEFTEQEAPTRSGNVTTYRFTSHHVQANDIYPGGDVSQIEITVTKGSDLKTGDSVTVKIPASMIPLRKYEVSVDATQQVTTEITKAYPIRLFYGVSVKQGAKEALAKLNTNKESEIGEPALTALKAYVAANNDGNGHVKFYANKYIADDQPQVYSSFEPSKTNNFYYFQENTLLYTDLACTIRATGSVNPNTTYYYQQTYYSKDVATKQTQAIAVSGATVDAEGKYIKSDASGLYIEAGAPKLTILQNHAINKTNPQTELLNVEEDTPVYYNLTETASYVTSPKWVDPTNPSIVNVALGNNGVFFADYTPAPVTLSGDANLMVTKTLNGREWQADDEFTFKLSAGDKATQDAVDNKEITLPSNADNLAINDQSIAADGVHQAAFDDVTFTKAGKYTLSIMEKPGDLSNMKYDSTPKTISVEVTYGTDGALMAAATGDKNPTFTNVYTKPAAPETPKPSTTTTTTVTSQAPAATPAPTAAPATKPAPTATPAATVIPQTGDESEPMVWVTLMGVSALALVALAVYRKKRSSK